MTTDGTSGSEAPLVAAVIAADPARAAMIRRELAPALQATGTVVVEAPTVEAALAARTEGNLLALLVVDAGAATASPQLDVDRVLAPAAGLDPVPSIVLLSERHHHTDVHRSLDRDLVHAIVAVPWTVGEVAHQGRSQLARWLRRRDATDARLQALDDGARLAEGPTSQMLLDLELDDHDLTLRLLRDIEGVLGPLPRLQLPAGTRLTHQDVGVDGVVIVVQGAVALHRHTEIGDLRLHHASTGPVVGLLSLAQQRQAFFTSRATTDVEVVHLSLEQLDRALQLEPEVGAALAAVSVRALARRLRRAEQLQVREVKLNRELDRERERLADALAELEATRLELIETERMATLGELAAGVAHELNNPVAALTRAATYVATDLEALLAVHPRSQALAEVLTTAHRRPPRSTAEDRRARRAIADRIGDATLADRLVAAGIDDPDDASRIADSADAGELARAADLGSALRNLTTAAGSVAELVDSLRAYARPSTQRPQDDVDLHATVEDALRLVGHRLDRVEVIRDYAADLPRLRAHPGPLSQVWANLLVNAADALAGSGTIRITTRCPDPGHVEVRIGDDGPGMADEVQERLFTPRFTTKQGAVHYGLGTGLAISRRIVATHGGTIEVASTTDEPSGTEVLVQLPTAGPPPDTEGST